MDRGNNKICIHPLNNHERLLQPSDRFYAGDPLAGVIPSHSSPAPRPSAILSHPSLCLSGRSWTQTPGRPEEPVTT